MNRITRRWNQVPSGWHEDQQDVMPWMTYFWGVLIRAYKEFQDRVGTIDIRRGSKAQQVREGVDRQIAPFRIADFAREVPGVGRETIRLVLREMKNEGRLKVEGRGPGARWLPVAGKK